MTSKTNKEMYSKMDPIDHMLARSDTYVGSVRTKESDEFVANEKNGFRICRKTIQCSPAEQRIFIEILSNSIDNVSRSKKTKTPCTKIKVNVDIATGLTTVWNDGQSIPVEINKEEKCYNHSLIFGQLLTSSNYDDKEERVDISGRNGYGSKCTNVFSCFFKVRGFDPKNKKLFSQTWENNMKTVSEPIITTPELTKGFTEVSWIPDFKRFGINGYTEDIISLYCKYVVDASMLTGVEVYFNDTLIPINSLLDYSKLFSTQEDSDVLHFKNKDSEIVLVPSSHFQSISFASGVYTSLGGTHVDSWSEALFRPIVQKLSKPKGSSFTIADIKKFFKLFVVVNVVNPEFESQSKHRLESPVIAVAQKKQIDTILSWAVIDDIVRSKEMIVLKKLERKKKVFVKIDGLDPANNEGGPLSGECTLILVEGLSAKTYAVQGIEVGAFGKKGRDNFGIYPLRGKCLNVRNAKTASIANNNVVSDIIKALGIRHDLDYTQDNNYKTLRYGKVMIITDQDVDGFHISGLIQNLFHTLFPSLLERSDTFITSMQTPIVKVFLNKKELVFYDERQYQKYVASLPPNSKINKKYYKGLGSSSAQDIAGSFGKKMIEFKNDENALHNMNKVFHKKFADSRKDWLANYDPENIVLDWKGDQQEIVQLNMSDFLNTEMIKFSLNDCKRSLPNIFDGLKESHRKILYGCFLKKLKHSGKTLKVAQLAGYVSEHTAYHHGEQNLYDTITKMASSFPGSNNIPLLYRDGQFGSRISGGKDAANARYIFTKLDALTRLIFREEDDVLLERIVDDGDMVEPKFYIPIIPMILVNGITAGIGTGWSCSVPAYNPLDLINSIKVWLENDGEVIIKDPDDDTVISLLPSLIPWYRDYTGIIKPSGDGKFISYGNISQEKNTKVVDELPIGMWTDNFKETLDQLLEEKIVSKVKNYSTPKKVRFVITESKDGIQCNLETLKLHKYLYTTNMVMFTLQDKLKKFDTVDEIIDTFCSVRLEYYNKRKKHQIGQLEHEIKFLGNKKRFLQEVLNGHIKLFNDVGKKRTSRKTSEIIKELETRGYDKSTDEDTETVDEEYENTKGYDYLLRLQFRSITEENIDKLENDIASKISVRDLLHKTSEKQIWINDLDEFGKAYEKYIKVIDKEHSKKK